MKLIIYFFGVIIFFSSAAHALSGQTVSGTVFLDADNNGIKQRREKGIAGAGVSNGRDVVLTDSRGRYSISVKENDVLFVIKPSAYRYPVDKFNLPRFFYVYKPAGSPELAYPGVAPTGKLPRKNLI